MKRTFFQMLSVSIAIASLAIGCQQSSFVVSSPDQNLNVNLSVGDSDRLYYSVDYQSKPVLVQSKLGLVLEDSDFSKGMSIKSASKPELFNDEYDLFTGKQSHVTYQATKQTFTLKNQSGALMDVIFMVSNHGVAYRYSFSQQSSDVKKITNELSSYRFPEGTKGWLQPMSVAKTGWCETNNSYEEHYQFDVVPGTPSPLGAGWIYPALFNSKDVWMLISEADMGRTYCGTRLVTGSDSLEYKVGFPDSREAFTDGVVYPQSALPWSSPWRLMAVGSLADITESTLGTDLAAPAIKKDFSFVKPGISSWSWAILKDNSVVYDVQKQFIDFAADMKWSYCLVDVNWDRNIGYDKIKELADYAATKNVALILWYNSSGAWNSTVYSPKSMLLTREQRRAEFSRIKDMGIKGVKVDFFGGDGQSMMAYYIDIFEDAADFGLLVNCHGATLPRGWQRTYPNLITLEAIKGFEFITFDQKNADLAPQHCALLPFIRNVFDPMDFTPMNLSQIPGITRRTTNGFELALPVLFVSGVQHIAETPAGIATTPDYVKSFLQHLPSKWISSKFIDGYPGKYVVMARQAEDGWYIAGINGENSAKTIALNLDFIPADSKGTLITDGVEAGSFAQSDVSSKTEIAMQPNGGFVIYFAKSK